MQVTSNEAPFVYLATAILELGAWRKKKALEEQLAHTLLYRPRAFPGTRMRLMPPRKLLVLGRNGAHALWRRRRRSIRRQELQWLAHAAVTEELRLDLARKHLGQQRRHGVADLALDRHPIPVHLYVVGKRLQAA